MSHVVDVYLLRLSEDGGIAGGPLPGTSVSSDSISEYYLFDHNFIVSQDFPGRYRCFECYFPEAIKDGEPVESWSEGVIYWDFDSIESKIKKGECVPLSKTDNSYAEVLEAFKSKGNVREAWYSHHGPLEFVI